MTLWEAKGTQPHLEPTGDVREILELGRRLQAAASDHLIHNVFDDGGYKELLLLRMFNLRKLNREGDDAADDAGRRYEIKTVARVSSAGARKTSLSITTEHTLTQTNIDRYRQVFLWIIAVFDQARPEAIYEISPAKLEPYFAAWEAKLLTQGQAVGGAPNHINNPKIPWKYVVQNGLQVWPPRDIPLPRQIEEGLSQLDLHA
jgi:hypothetical protein